MTAPAITPALLSVVVVAESRLTVVTDVEPKVSPLITVPAVNPEDKAAEPSADVPEVGVAEPVTLTDPSTIL